MKIRPDKFRKEKGKELEVVNKDNSSLAQQTRNEFDLSRLSQDDSVILNHFYELYFKYVEYFDETDSHRFELERNHGKTKYQCTFYIGSPPTLVIQRQEYCRVYGYSDKHGMPIMYFTDSKEMIDPKKLSFPIDKFFHNYPNTTKKFISYIAKAGESYKQNYERREADYNSLLDFVKGKEEPIVGSERYYEAAPR